MKLAALDYETEKIQDRPVYPPVPVGCSLYVEGSRPKYLAWGHPTGNNVSKRDAVREIKATIKATAIVCHNLAFDHDVGEIHLNAPIIGRAKVVHDTEIIAYLNDPREPSLGLKPLADKWLAMPPDEQAELRDWILANVELEKGHKWAAYISEAPGGLVGKYAKGDTLRTMRLFKKLYPLIRKASMLEPYDIELRLIPLKLRMERQGVLTNERRLKQDLPKFEALKGTLDDRIKKRLKITKKFEATCPKGFFNLNSALQMADALEAAGKVDADAWIYTEPSDTYPLGQRSTSLQNLRPVCKDKKLILDIGMRSVLDTYTNTFFANWLKTGALANGRVHPTFNTIRSTDEHGGRGTKGTKTGRPSVSNPNFNNIPANAAESKNSEVLLAMAKLLRDEYGLKFLGMRDYIIPDPGCVFIDRDYKQQEIRVLAHYENGALMQQLLANPKLNVHKMVKGMIKEIVGLDLAHKHVKTIAFMEIYGSGLDHLAEELDTDRETAKELKGAYNDAIPGLAELKTELKLMVRDEIPIRTWGGRVYHCEPPQYVRRYQRWMDFGYKMLNLLVQGSSADITKKAMLQVDAAIDGDIRLQVYDQLVANSERSKYRGDMALMREAMEDIDLDVSLPTDGSWSAVSWAQLKPFKEAA